MEAEVQVQEIAKITTNHSDEIEATSDLSRWIPAPVAADRFDVSVRHLRRLAVAGKIERRRRAGITEFRIPEGFVTEEEADPTLIDEGTSMNEVAVRQETNPGQKSNETVAAIQVSEIGAESKKAEAEGDSFEDTIHVAAEDIEYLHAEIVPNELLATNRDLMSLVDNVISRWSEVSREKNDSTAEIKRALGRTYQLQQALSIWQHHASKLEQTLREQSHLVTRALDVADEAVSTRWTSKKRQKTLQDRIESMRTR